MSQGDNKYSTFTLIRSSLKELHQANDQHESVDTNTAVQLKAN